MTPARRHCTPRCARPCGQRRPGWTAACSAARCQHLLVQRHEFDRLVAGGLPASVQLGGVWPTHPASLHPQPELCIGPVPASSCCSCIWAWAGQLLPLLAQPARSTRFTNPLLVHPYCSSRDKPRQAPPDPRLYVYKQFATQLFAVSVSDTVSQRCFSYCVATLSQTSYRSTASATMHSVWCTAPCTLMAGASVVSTRRHSRFPGLRRQILSSSNARALPLPPETVIPHGVCGRLHSQVNASCFTTTRHHWGPSTFTHHIIWASAGQHVQATQPGGSVDTPHGEPSWVTHT